MSRRGPLRGTLTVGSKVTLTPDPWYDRAGIDSDVMWLRDGVQIAGAYGWSYVLTKADAGTKLSVSVNPTVSGGMYQTLNASARVAGLPLISATPTIAGTVKAGNVLTVKRGTWTWGTAFTYRWLRNGVPISGAYGFDLQGPDRRQGHQAHRPRHGLPVRLHDRLPDQRGVPRRLTNGFPGPASCRRGPGGEAIPVGRGATWQPQDRDPAVERHLHVGAPGSRGLRNSRPPQRIPRLRFHSAISSGATHSRWRGSPYPCPRPGRRAPGAATARVLDRASHAALQDRLRITGVDAGLDGRRVGE